MTPEGELKKEIKALLNERGAFWSMIPGGAYAKTGDPDMVVCYRGQYVAIEAKTIDGVQSNWQKMREVEVRRAGGLYVLARSVLDVTAALDGLDSFLDMQRERILRGEAVN